MDAFDADVLIYAAVPDHPLGRRVRALFPIDPVDADDRDNRMAGVGSVFLVPELLTKPMRDHADDELFELAALLGVRKFPARVKCATLSWHTLAAALKKEAGVSTE